MSKRYSIAEARKNLPSLVTEAESGYVVELTRRGDRVAVLLSIHEYQRMKGKRAAFKEAYTDFLSRFDLDEYLTQVERELLFRALDQAEGVRKKAAELLGMSFRQFRYRLAKHISPEVGDVAGD